jgi:hypothetical protein
VYTPQAANREIYDERFRVFIKTYKQMKGIYQQLNK